MRITSLLVKTTIKLILTFFVMVAIEIVVGIPDGLFWYVCIPVFVLVAYIDEHTGSEDYRSGRLRKIS